MPGPIDAAQAQELAARAVHNLYVARACWLVERLDTVEDYFLVVLGQDAGAIVAVGQQTGAVLASAGVHRMPADWLPSRQQVIVLADLGPRPVCSLVWQPSRMSRSPLYPFWRVSNGQRTVYIDHAGKVWPD